jgi:hypothetical protein
LRGHLKTRVTAAGWLAAAAGRFCVPCRRCTAWGAPKPKDQPTERHNPPRHRTARVGDVRAAPRAAAAPTAPAAAGAPAPPPHPGGRTGGLLSPL